MYSDEEDCCRHSSQDGYQRGCGQHGNSESFDLPLMSIEEEVKTLEEMKETLEERLEIVNKRLEILKR